MWTRKELKERGKTSFKANYWKAVLVGLIAAVLAGGGGYTGGTGSFSNAFNNGYKSGYEQAESEAKEKSAAAEKESTDADDKDDLNIEVSKDPDEEAISVTVDDTELLKNEIGKLIDEASNTSDETKAAAGAVAFMIFIIVLVIVLVAIAIGLVISAFLLNPIDMGCKKFFHKNLDEPAEVAKNVLFAFDHSYLNVVKTLFFRDLYLVLWSMLFVIPGIIKGYEYRMIPYLLSEHPDMDKKEAFAKSKAMMKGNKWKAFVLDLSFLGWELLSLLTCGILSVFYVTPYVNATNAALYDALKEKDYVEIETVEA